MDVVVNKENNTEIKFTIDGVDTSFVNALRRASMTEVPKLAIEYVRIVTNTSRMYDEMLAHRLGLIPLRSNEKIVGNLLMPEECDCDKYCAKCSVSFTLKKQGPCVVYSGDLVPSDPEIKPVYENIPIIKLEEDEKIELEAIAQLGLGKKHAKWRPTTACGYKYYPKIIIKDTCDNCQACIEECPKDVLKANKDTIKIENIEACSLCRACERICENESISVQYIDNKFIFKMETDGSMPPREILNKACDSIIKKADEIIKFCEGE